MAGYNEIRGLRVKYLSADPSNAEDGQVWYNDTTGTLRVQGMGVSAWSSASSLGTGRYLLSGFGSQTAAVASMGTIPPASSTAVTEEYNGSGWSAGTNYPGSGNAGGGAGTLTAGLIAGGTPSRTDAANEYDGSSWTGTGAMPTAADNLGSCGAGTQTNVIMAVGRTPSSGNSGTTASYKYNGSTFSAGPSLNTARMYGSHAGSGTGTAGLVFGGFIDPSPNAMTNTESFDGSSWSNTGALNVASSFCNGFGIQTDTVTNVNSPNYQGSERFDGTSWTALPNIGVATPGHGYFTSSGTSGTAGFIAGMSPGNNQTFEWNSSANTITAAAWASGNNMNTARGYLAGFGIQTSAVAVGGYDATARVANVEEYNGSAWSNATALPGASAYGGAAGIESAGLYFGGTTPPPAIVSTTLESNGSSWTSGNAMNTGRYNTGSAGTQTAALAAGGVPGSSSPPYTKATEHYDGTNWTAGGNMNSFSSAMGGAGTLTAGIMFGRGASPSSDDKNIEEYNGSAWTTSPAKMQVCEEYSASSQNAPSSNSIIFGNSPAIVNTEQWNGTICVTAPNLGTARRAAAGAGTGSSGLAFGSFSPPGALNATEEFTAETTAANPAKTITVS